MQIISDDQTVRSNTVKGLKDFNSQSLYLLTYLSTQGKKGERLVSMMPAIKNAWSNDDDIVELSTEIEMSENKEGSYDEKWLEKSKAKLLKLIDDEKRANLIMSRMQKRMKKQ